jgi:hypothetical protein
VRYGGRDFDEVAPAVTHAIAGDQHLGLDLPEAIEHRIGPHVGRADAPDPANAHHGEESDDRLRDVGQVGGHPVAWLQALRAQVQRQRGDLEPQLRPVQFALLPFFIAADQRLQAGRMGRADMPEHLLRIVDLRAFEPCRSRHSAFGQHGAMRRRRLQLVIVPDALPERLQLGAGPAPQRVVAVELQAALRAQPVLVQADLGDKWGTAHGEKLNATAPLGQSRKSLPSVVLSFRTSVLIFAAWTP